MGEVRFDLEGIPVACDADPQQLLGLHHHGRNPTAAGYAIDELLHLSRSSHTQRTMALRALTGLLKRRAVALVNIKNVRQRTLQYFHASFLMLRSPFCTCASPLPHLLE